MACMGADTVNGYGGGASDCSCDGKARVSCGGGVSVAWGCGACSNRLD